MQHQLNIFLLLFGALQGILLSIWFLKDNKGQLSNTYFGLFLTVIGLQLTFKVITKTWLMDNFYFPYVMSYTLPYLAGPFLFLYLKATRRNAFDISDLLHFVPFSVAVLVAALSDQFVSLSLLRVHPFTQSALQIVSLLTYGFASWRFAAPHLMKFIVGVVGCEAVISLTLAFMYVFYGRFPDVRLFFVLLTLLIYWISYKLVSAPHWFEGNGAPVISMESSKEAKYSHSGLKADEADRIEGLLDQVMLKERLFLDTSLSIDTVAARVGTSRHHLSQVLNNRIRKSYGEYLMDLRLEEARKRLSDPINLRFTIASLAMDSGFSSVSSFNDAFKRHFGITPSRFRDQHLKKMSA